MNDNAGPKFLILLGMLLLVVGILLVIASILAWVGVIPGWGLFYLIGAIASFVLHYVCVSLGGQYIGGLR